MNTLTLCKTAATAASFAIAGVAFGATTAQADYSAAKDRVAAEYKTDKDACASYSAHAKEVCLEQAKGKERVASAALDYNYTGKPGDAQKLALAKADSAFAVSKEMCDDRVGTPKDVCVSEAKAARVRALAEAKTGGKLVDARKDANDDTRDADYKVETEKCNALAGDAKSGCVRTAKTRFNKG